MKLNDNIRLNAKSVRFTQPRQRLTLGPLFLDGISKATDNIRETAKGGEWMPKKETLMCMARCKRKDGKIADYYVHRMGGGVVIIGPNLERYRCHPGVTNAEAARIEIARVCNVEVISITGP
jgi:hypothetical protein